MRLRTHRRVAQRGDRDVQREQQSDQDAGQDPGEKQAADRSLGDRAVDDHRDRRRDQDAERSAGGKRAADQRSLVAEPGQVGDRRRRDRRGGGDARSGHRREHGAGTDVRVQQPARQPAHPQAQGAVEAHADLGSLHQFPHDEEQRDREQRHVVRAVPDRVGRAAQLRGVEQDQPQQPGAAERHRDRHADDQEAEQRGKHGNDDRHDSPCLSPAVEVKCDRS